MHAKQKGNIGEMAIARDLMEKDYAVFTELGDLSKIDLVVIKDGISKTIQVKYITASKGAVHIKRTKSGPNYSYRYEIGDCDIFAIYVPDTNVIAYISMSDLCQIEETLTLRLSKPLNNIKSFHNFKDFTLERALRGHTHDTLPVYTKGDEMVQTLIHSRQKRKKSNYIQPTKINWPSKEELSKLVNSDMSMRAIGKQLGVSDNSIRKRCLKQGISWK